MQKTIEKHLSNAEFFVNDYLNFYEVNDMPYGLKCAFDFFEYFYPRKCLGSPYSCGVMMTSLCKFYKVMAKYNLVNPVETAADGVVIASPVYYASANGSLISLLDRLFYSNRSNLTMKVGASIAIARRGGASATFDELNKYFTISGMPIVSSYYWNSVHGRDKGEAVEDVEGLYTMRMLAKNMVFLMKSIALGKNEYGMPERETRKATNFIR